MFVLGIISVLQIAVLPGLLLLSIFPFPKTIFQGVAYTYVLSFLLNYLIAYVLTYFHIFFSSVIYLIIGLEVVAILYLQAKPRPYLKVQSLFAPFSQNRPQYLTQIVFAGVGILSLLIFLAYAARNLGTIFSYPDEMGSYNYWASQWIKNRMPSAFDTMGYPIAASANWAIGYLVLQNANVQFFNKFATSFFPVVAACSFWGLAIFRKSLAPLLASFIFFVVLKAYTPLFIGSGPLDVAVSCIMICVFLAAVDYWEEPTNWNKMIVLQLLAASAANLKQSGLFAACSALFIVFLAVWKRRAVFGGKFRFLGASLAIFLIFSLSWYLRIQYMIYQGLATSESAYLIRGIHGGASYGERFIKALGMLILGNPIFSFVTSKLILVFCILTLVAFSLRDRLIRSVMLVLAFPYFILWAFLFSYEPRTLAPVFPFISLAAAIGFFQLARFFLPEANKFSPSLRGASGRGGLWAMGICLILLPLGAIAQVTYFSEKTLSAKQLELQKQLIDPELNKKLYDLNQIEPFTGKIASIYGTLKFLPNLSKYYFHLRAPATLELISYLEDREDIHYLLVSVEPGLVTYSFPLTDEEALAHILKKIEDHKYAVKFRHHNLVLVKIR